MSDFRELLISRMIRIYGFEHKEVILFAIDAESLSESAENDKLLQKLVEFHEKYPDTKEN